FRRGRNSPRYAMQLHSAIGRPAIRFPSVHIAGTNGKSSVSRKVAAGLQASGLKVGLFTSPHIISTRERIVVNDEMISENEVYERLNQLFDIATQKRLRPSFFDYLTVLSASYFADQQVDVAVYEVGLGGRLDATNIITPEVSVITSISEDHMDRLGPTLDHVASEKAGIIKERVPLILGPFANYKPIIDKARALNAPIILVDPVEGNFEDENRAIARRVMMQLNLPEKAIEVGVKTTPRCRFEESSYRGKTVVIDVGHNPDALKRLLEAVDVRYPGKVVHVVFGLAKGKDYKGCVEVIASKVEHIHLPRIDHFRLEDPEVIIAAATKPNMSVCASVSEALEQAAVADLILVCGSFYMIESVLESIASTSSASR
ncbi:MAG: bifunctional folylpolyglutamate synthase/dihydrofolate synthase, partial [Chlamydiia bacterium]|nr:bifunctional folylpolyglutamate synthase/dihydrofolate synthase [Chlamydiia bacterium]